MPKQFTQEQQEQALKVMRKDFPANLVASKPNGTKKQNDEVKQNRSVGINCGICGQWHHKNAKHLEYVGHAALTDRLLDADPSWFWEPVAFNAETGLPQFDQSGGLWIRLHIAGISRLGYGNGAAKGFQEVGAREKEVIGDALRNAGMRFGAALDLWHKGDLDAHRKEEEANAAISTEQCAKIKDLLIQHEKDEATFCRIFGITSIRDLKAGYIDAAIAKIEGAQK